MSKIDYQALREAAERAIPAMERLLMLPADDDLLSEQELKDYGVDIDALNAFKFLTGPETVLALLDERERNITKERLLTIKQWRETYGPGSNVVLPAEEAEELARIALASLEAKPVAWECGENIILFNPDTVEAYAKRAEISPKPLFAAPPVPVVSEGLVKAVRFYEQVKRENPPVETGAWKDAVDWVLKEACQVVNTGIKGD